MSNATEMLAFYLDAEKKILLGQSVRFGERQLTRADLVEVRAGRREWEAKVNAEVTVARGGNAGYSVANFSGCD
ncbi:hypothetical protein [Arenimonas oryziterrae]|uniref:Primosomal replication protein PriB/PriC domain protein n=2 Tax=Arenimonas TaxID=490567 RepID=A0A091BD49_9GAMM|nr:hypothetical protein [Arenimonas oryziterrae]KFN42330.1 hypothetical protein N789_14155 [Arenimonas oryziterrae DSM 21050 = YC6267]